MEYTTQQVEATLAGRSLGTGGLNVPEIKKVLRHYRIPFTSRAQRADLVDLLKQVPALMPGAAAPVPVPAPAARVRHTGKQAEEMARYKQYYDDEYGTSKTKSSALRLRQRFIDMTRQNRLNMLEQNTPHRREKALAEKVHNAFNTRFKCDCVDLGIPDDRIPPGAPQHLFGDDYAAQLSSGQIIRLRMGNRCVCYNVVALLHYLTVNFGNFEELWSDPTTGQPYSPEQRSRIKRLRDRTDLAKDSAINYAANMDMRNAEALQRIKNMQ
jgi:hypothetical protein